MTRTAVFIDGAYLDFVLREEFSLAKIDYELLIGKLSGRRDLLRAYYYCCLPYQSSIPTDEEKRRLAAAQSFHSALARIEQFEVRMGKLEFRGKDETGKPRFEQKRVDILLGVDLVQLAVKGRIADAVLLAGDSDFLPAIEVAKHEGVKVHLVHGTKPHQDLVDKCDRRLRIDVEFIKSIRR